MNNRRIVVVTFILILFLKSGNTLISGVSNRRIVVLTFILILFLKSVNTLISESGPQNLSFKGSISQSWFICHHLPKENYIHRNCKWENSRITIFSERRRETHLINFIFCNFCKIMDFICEIMDFKRRLLQEIFVWVYNLYFTTFLQEKQKRYFNLEEVKQARFKHWEVLIEIGLLEVIATYLKVHVEEFIFSWNCSLCVSCSLNKNKLYVKYFSEIFRKWLWILWLHWDCKNIIFRNTSWWSPGKYLSERLKRKTTQVQPFWLFS